MSSGIKASVNKFAFLHVQDSSDESDSMENISTARRGQVKSTQLSGNTSSNSKKKSRRRKKKNSNSVSSDTAENVGTEKRLKDWMEHDQHLVEDLYNEDLKRAIEMSKVEYEKLETMLTDTDLMNGSVKQQFDMTDGDNHTGAKKEKKKSKAVKTISLEEFHKHIEKTLPLHDVEDNNGMKATVNKETSQKSDFFEEVDKQATYIKRNEAALERFQKEHNQKANAQKSNSKTNKHDRHLQKQEEKDQIIEKLENKVGELEQQFKHVKKRNKQLLVMLQQGEMKDKCELLMEIERLTVLREELTDEVSNLNEGLEQERSRSRKLKDEVLKLQAKTQ